jgi:hypothetical protein
MQVHLKLFRLRQRRLAMSLCPKRLLFDCCLREFACASKPRVKSRLQRVRKSMLSWWVPFLLLQLSKESCDWRQGAVASMRHSMGASALDQHNTFPKNFGALATTNASLLLD